MPEKLYTLYLGYKTHQIHHLLCILPYGKIPEWPNGSDCKSDVSDFGSSNLPLPTRKKRQKHVENTVFAVFSLFFALSPRNLFMRTFPKPQLKTQLFVQPFLPEILFPFQNHSSRSPFGCYFSTRVEKSKQFHCRPRRPLRRDAGKRFRNGKKIRRRATPEK